MATGHINIGALLKRGHLAELGRRRTTEADTRAAARTILEPSEVAGDYDAGRLLMTTLRGELRPITLEDLRTFSQNANRLGKRFKGGITAKGVIDLSLQVDRDRANAEIRTAVVMRAKAGELYFLTNAGPESDVTRHHVNVIFPTFGAYTATANKPEHLAREMLNGTLRFECDCGRFRYWYRYLASKGNFVAGRVETGYPKIRNPKLVGVACKHALRVMVALLKDRTVLARATAMIEAAQHNNVKAQAASAAEAKAAAEKQLHEQHHRKNQAETTDQRAKRLSQTAAARARVLFAANKEAARRLAAERNAGRKALESAFAKLKTVPLTKAMRDALIAKLTAAKTID